MIAFHYNKAYINCFEYDNGSQNEVSHDAGIGDEPTELRPRLRQPKQSYTDLPAIEPGPEGSVWVRRSAALANAGCQRRHIPQLENRNFKCSTAYLVETFDDGDARRQHKLNPRV